MTKTIKTAILALIIVSATLMGGCLDGSDTAKEDVTIERMVQLEATLTDPEISEEKKIAAYTLAHEAITGEKLELNSEADVTTSNNITKKYYAIGTTMSQGSCDIINGTCELLVSIREGHDLNLLKEVRVIVNNETIDILPGECQNHRKVECNIIGEWYVVLEGLYADGTIQQIHQTRFNGIPELKDVPNAGALGERYIEVREGQMTRAEAKALCDELGIVWGDERDS